MNERALSLAPPRASVRRWIGGLCVFLFLGGLAVLAVWSGGWLQYREEFLVRFTGPTGLTKSSLVLLLGQPVGRVSDLRVAAVDGRPTVEARFWIDRAHLDWLTEGANVTMRSSLVGAPWLDLQPGAPGQSRLVPGSVVTGGVEPDLMARLLEIQPVVEHLIKEVDVLIGTLTGTVQRIDPILVQVEGQLVAMQQAVNEVTVLIRDTHGLFAQVKEDQAALVGGLATTLKQVNEELLPGLDQMINDSRGMVVGTFGELDQTLDLVQARLPDLLLATQQTLENTRDITEATKHAWLFKGYWKRKAREEAAAAKNAAAGTER